MSNHNVVHLKLKYYSLSTIFQLLLFNLSVMSDCLQPHGLQHARLPCLSLSVGVCSNSCPTICNPINCSMPGFPVHHQPPKFAKTHVHWVSDAIQPAHPLSAPSPPAFNLSQHQGLFQWVGSRIRWPKCWNLSFSISPSNEFSVDFL